MGGKCVQLPKLIKVRQYFDADKITDIPGEVREQIKKAGIKIKPGDKIAIATGSRGVANISLVVKTVVEVVREMGGEPFIVPAMGSHGGATAEGQKAVLESYGITEEYVGAPIKSSMEVVELPQGDLPNRVFMDKHAYEADGTIVINRIKVHTDFHGPLESGLMKMIVIGLGKHAQAFAIHRYNLYGLKELILPTARQILRHGNIIMGLGLVENACDETAVIRALQPEEIEDEEKKLLDIARKNVPSLPTDKLDVLLIDRMGKDISGSGMDTNIIGRIRIRGEKEPEKPDITNIVVTDLTEGSHGNALGVGLADIITERLKNKIDFGITYENVVTSTFLERGKLPIVAPNDRIALEYALKTCGPVDSENVRMIRIRDTLHLGELYVSRAVLDEIKDKPNIEVIGSFQDIIDGDGKLVEF